MNRESTRSTFDLIRVVSCAFVLHLAYVLSTSRASVAAVAGPGRQGRLHGRFERGGGGAVVADEAFDQAAVAVEDVGLRDRVRVGEDGRRERVVRVAERV